MNVLEFLKPRYKVKGYYPGSPFKVGEILYEFTTNAGTSFGSLDGKRLIDEDEILKADLLFKLLWWYEDRTIEEMAQVEYVKVVESCGYWVVGDIVKVDEYLLDTKPKPKFRGYKLSLNEYPQHCVEPANERQYELFKANEKKR